MKKDIFNLMLVLIMAFVGVVLVSCDKKEDDSENVQDNPVPVEKEQASMRTGYYYYTFGDKLAKKYANDHVQAGDYYNLKRIDWSHYTQPMIHVVKGNIIEIVDRYVDDFYGKESPSMWYDKESYYIGKTTATLYFYIDDYPTETMTYTLDGNKIITSNKIWNGMTYENGEIIPEQGADYAFKRTDRLK